MNKGTSYATIQYIPVVYLLMLARQLNHSENEFTKSFLKQKLFHIKTLDCLLTARDIIIFLILEIYKLYFLDLVIISNFLKWDEIQFPYLLNGSNFKNMYVLPVNQE